MNETTEKKRSKTTLHDFLLGNGMLYSLETKIVKDIFFHSLHMLFALNEIETIKNLEVIMQY